MVKLPISVCMISGAEVHRIGRALASLAQWPSEVVVVLNQEVTDGTEELCLKHGAKVFREPWKGYVAQKNSVAQKASFPWILALDADEAIPSELWNEISATVQDPDAGNRYAAFEFPRCSYYCGRWIRHGDWYPDRVVRLWRKGAAAYVGQGIHERLQVNGGIGRLKADLLHFSNENINWQLDKIGRYADPFVRQSLAAGRNANWLDFTLRPLWKFARAYFFRLGFLDGWPGYYIAWVGAFSTLTRYVKIREALVTSAGAQLGSQTQGDQL